jgi:hypothetical protein
MNQTISSIQPYQHVTTQQVCGFSIRVQQVILFDSCIVAVNTYDINNNLLNVQMVTIAGEAYKAWASDDEYITSYVAAQLGFTMAPDPVAPDPVAPDPVAPDPVVTDPVVTDPVVTDPVVTDPVVTDPGV